MLRIFSPEKIQRLWPGVNPRSWVPKASSVIRSNYFNLWQCLQSLNATKLRWVLRKSEQNQLLSTYTDARSSIRERHMHLDKESSKKEFYTFRPTKLLKKCHCGQCCCVASTKETTDWACLRCCPNQGVWIRLHYFEGVREWRWLCSVTFTDFSWDSLLIIRSYTSKGD
jgi:hypothetical protein